MRLSNKVRINNVNQDSYWKDGNTENILENNEDNFKDFDDCDYLIIEDINRKKYVYMENLDSGSINDIIQKSDALKRTINEEEIKVSIEETYDAGISCSYDYVINFLNKIKKIM